MNNPHGPLTRWRRRHLVFAAGLALCGPLRAQQTQGSYGQFFDAVRKDDASLVHGLLVRGFDPNTRAPDGQTGLLIAVQEPALKVFDILVSHPRIDVNLRNPVDESPLMLAALRGRMAMVKALVALDADVNKTGWTPLHYAATGGHVDIINWLLDHHAYIDAESPNRGTPLMMAAQYGSQAAVELLLESGADASLRNELGLNAVDFAERVGRQVVAERIAAHIRKLQPKGKW